MNLVNLIQFLRDRLKTLIWIAYAILALVVVLDAIPAIVDKEHAHTALERWPGFWALYGFVACVLIIILSKWYGHLGIMTREDYYEDGAEAPPSPGAATSASGGARSIPDRLASRSLPHTGMGTLRRGGTMTNLWFHPALVLILGALLLPLVPTSLKKGYLLLIPILLFARILTLARGEFGQVHFLDWTLVFGRVDALSSVFGYIMSLMCIIGTLYGLHVKDDSQHIAAWFYVAGSIGCIYAGDFITLFLFWELMAFSSVFLIWFRGRRESLSAGYRYLLVHIAGGVILLAGIVLHCKAPGHDWSFNQLDVHHPTTAIYLIMAGFILNAAVPPLHAWLPDAYGEATFNGSVFMCAFTTKTAVYALCRGFAGMEILVPLGVIMALYGVVYAVLENDCRRLLAYHIISQVGYMVAGVGLGTEMAINGACAHAFAHILYKGLLFMGCGAVLHMTGQSKFTELGGLWKKMP